MGAVSGTVTFGRSFGTSIGISLFAAVFYGRLTDELAARVPDGALDGIDRNSLSSDTVLATLADPVRGAVEDAYAASLTPVFTTAVPILAVGLVLTLLMKNLTLRSRHHGRRAGREPGAGRRRRHPRDGLITYIPRM
ncbi:hypothetical protein [Streptomyces sp. RB110-2]|uniref:hypothetical protein n=1 Tax=Streptomyces sp. RB110-2 TaxID=2794863 RepID=UPI001F47B2E9|nr:hypothetical protein [Streptomyces sp. RB110-2]